MIRRSLMARVWQQRSFTRMLIARHQLIATTGLGRRLIRGLPPAPRLGLASPRPTADAQDELFAPLDASPLVAEAIDVAPEAPAPVAAPPMPTGAAAAPTAPPVAPADSLPDLARRMQGRPALAAPSPTPPAVDAPPALTRRQPLGQRVQEQRTASAPLATPTPSSTPAAGAAPAPRPLVSESSTTAPAVRPRAVIVDPETSAEATPVTPSIPAPPETASAPRTGEAALPAPFGPPPAEPGQLGTLLPQADAVESTDVLPPAVTPPMSDLSVSDRADDRPSPLAAQDEQSRASGATRQATTATFASNGSTVSSSPATPELAPMPVQAAPPVLLPPVVLPPMVLPARVESELPQVVSGDVDAPSVALSPRTILPLPMLEPLSELEASADPTAPDPGSPMDWAARLFRTKRVDGASPSLAPASVPTWLPQPPSPEASHPAASQPAPISDATRRFLRPLVGIDLDSVPVYRGRLAQAVAEPLVADAVTVGEQVFIATPDEERSPRALGLLAHELTHVVRSREPRFVPPVVRGQHAPTSSEESLATAVEARVVAAAAAASQATPGVSSAPRQRAAPVGSTLPPDVPPEQEAPFAWNGLPAPWEPLPDWLMAAAPAFDADPPPAAPPPAIVSAPTSVTPSGAPAVQLAEIGRELETPPRPPAQDTPAQTPAAPPPDLDQLARQVYTIVKQRLAAERRRSST